MISRLKAANEYDPNPANKKEFDRLFPCVLNACLREAESSPGLGALLARATARIHGPNEPIVQPEKRTDDEILGKEASIEEAEALSEKALRQAKASQEAAGDKFMMENEARKASGNRRETMAEPACAKGKTACKAACESKAEFALEACVVHGISLSKEANPDLISVKGLYRKACDGGVPEACDLLPDIDKAVVAQAKKREKAMETAISEGDEVATKGFMAKALASMGGRVRARNAATMKVIVAAQIREAFCPSKKEAIATLGQKEFASRASKHCEEDAPTTQGLSGKQVELKAECKAVFALPCP